MSLYNFNQIFLLFFEDFFSVVRTRRFEELLLFWSGLQSYNLYHFYQIFLPIFEDFFLRSLTRFLKNYSLFLEADGKDTRSIFISKFFLCFSLTLYQHHYSLYSSSAIPSAKNLSDLLTYIVSSFSLLTTSFFEVSVSNRVAKIDSSASLPNIFVSFFETRREMQYQQGFQKKKTFKGCAAAFAVVLS